MALNSLLPQEPSQRGNAFASNSGSPARSPFAKTAASAGSPQMPRMQAPDPSRLARLSQSDAEFLCALSAMQIRYGRAHEAVAYLMFLRQTDPDNQQAIRLLAAALMKLGRWEEADVVASGLNEGAGKRAALMRAIIAFRVSNISAARRYFSDFCARIRGALS